MLGLVEYECVGLVTHFSRLASSHKIGFLEFTRVDLISRLPNGYYLLQLNWLRCMLTNKSVCNVRQSGSLLNVESKEADFDGVSGRCDVSQNL